MISGDNTKALDDIRSLIEGNQLSFLIGAGFSRNISKSFPLWRELLSDAVWKKYGTGRDADRAKWEKGVLDKVLREKSLLDVASEIVAGAGYHEAIDDYIEAHVPFVAASGDKLVLMKDGVEMPDEVKTDCHTLLRQLDVRNIYTFNYDNALEYFLGDKSALLAKREALIKERDAEQDKLKGIEDSLYNLRKEPPRELLSGDIVPLGLSEEDSLVRKNPEKQERDLCIVLKKVDSQKRVNLYETTHQFAAKVLSTGDRHLSADRLFQLQNRETETCPCLQKTDVDMDS